METLLAPLVQACDAISGARPGARREAVESYIKRLNDLENMALSYPGVTKTYAIQAGRELRVIVGSDKMTDAEAESLSYDIASINSGGRIIHSFSPELFFRRKGSLIETLTRTIPLSSLLISASLR